MPSGIAMPVPGGYRVQGRWRYSSGCEHCDWAFLGATIEGAAGGYPDRCLFLIPRSDYEIIDTWHVSGLKGTGSHDIAVKDAFVPAHRMIRYSDNFKGVAPGLAVNTSPLYRLPWGQVFFRGVATGVDRRAAGHARHLSRVRQVARQPACSAPRRSTIRWCS